MSISLKDQNIAVNCVDPSVHICALGPVRAKGVGFLVINTESTFLHPVISVTLNVYRIVAKGFVIIEGVAAPEIIYVVGLHVFGYKGEAKALLLTLTISP